MNWSWILIETLGFIVSTNCIVVVDFTGLQEARAAYYSAKFRLDSLQGRGDSPWRVLVDSQSQLKRITHKALPYHLRKDADKLQESLDLLLKEYHILTAPPLNPVKSVTDLRQDVSTLKMKLLMEKEELLRSYPNILDSDPLQISLKNIERNCYSLESAALVKSIVERIRTSVRKLSREDMMESRQAQMSAHRRAGDVKDTNHQKGSLHSKPGFLSNEEKYQILQEQLNSVKKSLQNLRAKRVSTLKEFGLDPTIIRLQDAWTNLLKLRHWLQHQAWMSTRPSPIPHAIMTEASNLHNSILKNFQDPEILKKLKAYHQKFKSLSPSQKDQERDINDTIRLQEYLMSSLRQRMRQIYHLIISNDQSTIENTRIRAKILGEKLDAMATISVSGTRAQNTYYASDLVDNLKEFLHYSEMNTNDGNILNRRVSFTSHKASKLSSEIAILKKFLLLNAPNPASVKAIARSQNMSNILRNCIHILEKMSGKSVDPLFLEAQSDIAKVESDFNQRFPPPAYSAPLNTAKDFDTALGIYQDKIADLYFLLEHSITQSTLLALINKAVKTMQRLIASESSPTNRQSELQVLNNLKKVQTFLLDNH